MYVLKIKINTDDQDVLKYYNNYQLSEEDSGVDLIIPQDYQTSVLEQTTIDHKISCEMLKATKDNIFHVGYLLMPRSSISKTKFRMANSVGLIDMGYRGSIMAKVDTLPSYYTNDNGIVQFFDEQKIIKKGTRMFQIVAPGLEPIRKIIIVNELSESVRGSGGFGSTN